MPFGLCLRIWDIYLLDGERVITAMAFTILKLHKRNIMKLNDMDSIVNFIQVSFVKFVEVYHLYQKIGRSEIDTRFLAEKGKRK